MDNVTRQTAPCGLDCFNCEIHQDNITDELRAHMADKTGRAPEEIACMGCRAQNGCKLFPGTCATLQCVRAHEVEFCYACEDFPCTKLQPAREGAERFPHNFKLFNLCRIKAIGIEAWKEEAKEIRARYFAGTFIPGVGPVAKD